MPKNSNMKGKGKSKRANKKVGASAADADDDLDDILAELQADDGSNLPAITAGGSVSTGNHPRCDQAGRQGSAQAMGAAGGSGEKCR
jgi:hypothetical protein